MKRIVIDLDHTVCAPDGDADQTLDPFAHYREARPVEGVIQAMRRYKSEGFEIAIFTARNMRTFSGDVEKIREHTLPIVLDWLDRHGVPYDEVIVGKPWCGVEGFYVDDRAVRPTEFASLSFEQISAMLDAERDAG